MKESSICILCDRTPPQYRYEYPHLEKTGMDICVKSNNVTQLDYRHSNSLSVVSSAVRPRVDVSFENELNKIR